MPRASSAGQPVGQRVAQDRFSRGGTLTATVDHDYAVDFLRTGALETYCEQTGGRVLSSAMKIDSLHWLDLASAEGE